MKKKSFFAVLVTVAVLSGISSYSIQKEHSDINNSLLRANVQALTSKNEEELTMPCSSSITYTGSWNDMAMSCSSCSFRPGYSGSNDSRCR